MNDQKLLKKIFNLAYYDFNNNFNNWFSIAGLHAVILTIIFGGLCYVTCDYTVLYWGWLPNMLIDWSNKLYSLVLNDTAASMLAVISLVLLVAGVVLPLVVIQNALDLAFDSSMSGYSSRPANIVSYCGAILFCNSAILLGMQVISYATILLMLYCLPCNSAIYVFGVKICMAIMAGLFVYAMQLSYFLSMHILEYKKGIVQSCKDVMRMITHKMGFLCKILALQVLVSSWVIAFLYMFLGTVIALIMPIILWFFTVVHITVAPAFIVMMYNFFYVWAYVLLYVWICLVMAHVYRQLICPPVDNPVCASCTSCEK